MNRRFLLDQRLRAVAVMNVPIHDQHALHAASPERVVRADRHVAEEAESHPISLQRVMARRPHGAERARATVDRHVDRVEDTTNRRSRGVARALAHHRIGIEQAASRHGEAVHVLDVPGIMHEQKVIVGGQSTLDVLERVIQLDILTERAGNRAQAPHVFRMTPASVVPAAVSVRDVRNFHATPRSRRESHSASSAIAASAASQASSGNDGVRRGWPAGLMG